MTEFDIELLAHLTHMTDKPLSVCLDKITESELCIGDNEFSAAMKEAVVACSMEAAVGDIKL